MEKEKIKGERVTKKTQEIEDSSEYFLIRENWRKKTWEGEKKTERIW